MPAIRTRLWVAVRRDFGVGRGALVLSGGIAASDTSGAEVLLLPGVLQTMPREKQNSHHQVQRFSLRLVFRPYIRFTAKV